MIIMGLVSIKILFESRMPSFKDIQEGFSKQTGLHIGLATTLHMLQLSTDSEQILTILQQDGERIKQLEQEYALVRETARLTEDYATAAHYRDTQYKPILDKLNRIEGYIFIIHDFYNIDFFIQDNMIEISYIVGPVYGASSLAKVLIDLGGKFEDSRISYPKRWKHLRKWEDYNWWNRPNK